MTVGQKASISVFISLLVFSFVLLISQTGLFSYLENRIYSQVKVQEKQEYLTSISDECEDFVNTVLSAISTGEDAFLRSRYTESYLKIDPSEYEVANRRKLTENLFYQYPALEGVRLIDDRQNICFSTFNDTDLTDVEENLRENNYLRYRNYEDVASEEGLVHLYNLRDENSRHLNRKIFLDTIRNQFVVSVRFQPSNLARNVAAIKSGTFVFYFDIDVFENLLLEKRILNISDNLVPVTNSIGVKDREPFGFIVLSNIRTQQDMKNAVLKNWSNHEKNRFVNKYGIENLTEQSEDSSIVMLSVPCEDKYFHISGIYDSKTFVFTRDLIALIYLCLFISLLLTIFLFFSFKVDYSVVIKKRITRLQFEIINQYLENKASVDWSIVAEQIESKRKILSDDIKKSFGKKGIRYSEQIDSLLNKSWTEIISVMKSGADKTDENVLMNEIKKMLEEILNTGNLHYKAMNTAGARPLVVNTEKNEAEGELLELYDEEELENYRQSEVETVIPENVHVHTTAPSINGDSTIKIDPVVNNPDINQVIYGEDDLAELLAQHEENHQTAEVVEELEEIEDLEEIVEDEVEEIDELEDLEETEDEEELKSDDSVPETDAIDELDKVEEIEEIEEIDEVEEADELEEISEAEDLEDLDEPEDLEEVSELEELDSETPLRESAQVVEDMYEPTAKKNAVHHRRYEYSDDTYTSDDLEVFPTVDNVFAEELCLGKEYTRRTFSTSQSFDFVVKAPLFGMKVDDTDDGDNLEELTDEISELAEEVDDVSETMEKTEEEIPEISNETTEADLPDDSEKIDEDVFEMNELNNSGTFVMTEFAKSAGRVSDLIAEKDAIVEKDGVFSIADDITFTDIIQNEDFKSLVDSVLK